MIVLFLNFIQVKITLSCTLLIIIIIIGLHEWAVFEALFNLIQPCLPNQTNKLSQFDMVMMFFLKIRLNLMDEDIAFRYGIHHSTVSQNFYQMLDVIYVRTSLLVQWPDREVLLLTMPSSFRRMFDSCAVIIDCTEVLIEQPSNLLARAQVWSKYKHQSTVKFLIGITPQGTLSFLSKSYGGCISDEELFEQSGFIDHLLPGMILMFIATY